MTLTNSNVVYHIVEDDSNDDNDDDDNDIVKFEPNITNDNQQRRPMSQPLLQPLVPTPPSHQPILNNFTKVNIQADDNVNTNTSADQNENIDDDILLSDHSYAATKSNSDTMMGNYHHDSINNYNNNNNITDFQNLNGCSRRNTIRKPTNRIYIRRHDRQLFPVTAVAATAKYETDNDEDANDDDDNNENVNMAEIIGDQELFRIRNKLKKIKLSLSKLESHVIKHKSITKRKNSKKFTNKIFNCLKYPLLSLAGSAGIYYIGHHSGIAALSMLNLIIPHDRLAASTSYLISTLQGYIK